MAHGGRREGPPGAALPVSGPCGAAAPHGPDRRGGPDRSGLLRGRTASRACGAVSRTWCERFGTPVTPARRVAGSGRARYADEVRATPPRADGAGAPAGPGRGWCWCSGSPRPWTVPVPGPALVVAGAPVGAGPSRSWVVPGPRSAPVAQAGMHRAACPARRRQAHRGAQGRVPWTGTAPAAIHSMRSPRGARARRAGPRAAPGVVSPPGGSSSARTSALTDAVPLVGRSARRPERHPGCAQSRGAVGGLRPSCPGRSGRPFVAA